MASYFQPHATQKKTDLDTLTVTFEVTSLYSYISHEFKRQAIWFWIENNLRNIKPKMQQKIISGGIERIINNNLLKFNIINHIQNMVTKIAPTYTVLTLEYLEENLDEIKGKNTTII